MTEHEERELRARLATAETQIRLLQDAVRRLEARNRPLGPKPGTWPTLPPKRLRPLIEPGEHLKFTSSD